MSKKSILAMTVICAAIAFSSSAIAQTSTTMSPDQQKQVENVVHNYLVKNPEVLVESLQVLQKRQIDQAHQTMEKTQKSAPQYANALFHQTDDPTVGNPNGKVTMVEFFDYQCPHCIEMTPVIESMIKSDPDLRIVFKEFPIRGPMSEVAAKAALAAKKQGKYFELHKAIMQIVQQQPLTEEAILKAAKSVGINVDTLKADMKSDAVSQKLKANTKLAQDLQLLGTPAFFIAKSSIQNNAAPTAIAFVPGQVDQGQLDAIVVKLDK